MKILVLLFCVLSFICCDNQEILDIKYLKENGYEEITCSYVESYQTNESSFIEVSKKLFNKETYILARCFDKDSCLLNIKLKSDKIVCQRYIVSKETEDKRDYMHNDYKEYVDHRVLYLSIGSKNEKEIIKRVN